jgi:hypothetical protein
MGKATAGPQSQNVPAMLAIQPMHLRPGNVCCALHPPEPFEKIAIMAPPPGKRTTDRKTARG